MQRRYPIVERPLSPRDYDMPVGWWGWNWEPPVPMSITQLSTGFPITRQAITKHLRVMQRAGLVGSTQRGREIVWEIEKRRLAEARRHLETISAQWDETLGRLKAFVER